MDLTTLTTILGLITAALGLPAIVFAALKAWQEHRQHRLERLKASAELAHTLSQRYPQVPALERLALQRATAALVPDPTLTHDQRTVLLAQPDSDDLIAHYTDKRAWLQVSLQNPWGVDWRHRRLDRRLWRYSLVGAFFLAYTASVGAAFWPSLAWQLKMGTAAMPPALAGVQLVFLALFVPVSLWLLKHGSQLVGTASYLAARRQRITRVALQNRVL